MDEGDCYEIDVGGPTLVSSGNLLGSVPIGHRNVMRYSRNSGRAGKLAGLAGCLGGAARGARRRAPGNTEANPKDLARSKA